MNLRSSMWKEWSYSENHMINSVQRQYGDYFYAVGGWYWLKGISVGLLRSWWCSISWCRCKSQNSVHFVKMHEALHWWYCPFPHGYYILYFSKYAYYMLYFSEKKKREKLVLIYWNLMKNKTHSLVTLLQLRAIFICPKSRTN